MDCPVLPVQIPASCQLLAAAPTTRQAPSRLRRPGSCHTKLPLNTCFTLMVEPRSLSASVWSDRTPTDPSARCSNRSAVLAVCDSTYVSLNPNENPFLSRRWAENCRVWLQENCWLVVCDTVMLPRPW